ncbi:MAG: P-type conjugative transfer protein TrbJ, partial [Pseudomonadota bacterium]|nr:P-type conjugative transfer protein TrbJ [Pseudomonadota bacterium]
MRLRLRCVTTLAFAIAVSAPLVLPMRAEAQWAVIDHANLSQNILTAARALEQINNQIRSLQNQTFMLQNMALDLKSLDVSQLGGITR